MINECLNEYSHIQNCPYFQDSVEPLFEKITLSGGQTYVNKTSPATLAFLLEGQVWFEAEDNANAIIGEGSIFIIPPVSVSVLRAHGKCELVMYRLHNESSFPGCIRYCLLGHPISARSKTFTNLTISQGVRELIELALKYNSQESNCRILAMSSMHSVIHRLIIEYPVERLADFFSTAFPIGNLYRKNIDSNFRSIIMQNRNRLFQVKDFARLTNQSIGSFRMSFKQIFGCTPQRWIAEERKKLIMHELIEGSRPIQEIYELAGFGSPQEFSKFCKNHFGLAPSHIRKNC
jgi:AraC-like DNA-binding protein